MVTIDATAAEQHIDNDPDDRRLPLLNQIEMIDSGGWFYRVDQFGRARTNITNLAKDLRTYLAVNGRRLAGIDIVNSQPLFLGGNDHRNSRVRQNGGLACAGGLQVTLPQTAERRGGGTRTLTMCSPATNRFWARRPHRPALRAGGRSRRQNQRRCETQNHQGAVLQQQPLGRATAGRYLQAKTLSRISSTARWTGCIPTS